jgi:nucleoside-diphosphate-sugar epimerase
MRIIFIGGTKFIGLHTVECLTGMGHEVTVFHRGKTPVELPDGASELLGDMNQLDDYVDDFKRIAPDVVIHNILIQESDAERLMHVFKDVAKRVIGVSSGDVYLGYGRLIDFEPGDPVPVPMTEDAPLRTKLYPYREQVNDPNHPMHNYDKIPIEKLVMGSPDDLPGTVLRLPMVYGPRDFQRRIYSYLKRMDDRRPAILVDERSAMTRFSRGYVEDVAAAIALAATDERAANRIYNVAEPDPLSEIEWIKMIADVVGWQGDIIAVDPVLLPEDQQFDPHGQDLVVDSTRIRTELDFKEAISREEAIRRTVAYDREHPPEQTPNDSFDYEAEDAILAQLS